MVSRNKTKGIFGVVQAEVLQVVARVLPTHPGCIKPVGVEKPIVKRAASQPHPVHRLRILEPNARLQNSPPTVVDGDIKKALWAEVLRHSPPLHDTEGALDIFPH